MKNEGTDATTRRRSPCCSNQLPAEPSKLGTAGDTTRKSYATSASKGSAPGPSVSGLEAYGIPHSIISLDDSFLKSLPDLTLAASLLSGGLASVEQAHEVYVYEQLRGLGSTRISGYLGNQLGRGGVEQVSARDGDIDVLAEPQRRSAGNRTKAHWLTQAFEKTHHSLPRLLIQREVPFSSVANYAIGSYFMEQQSPYASRRLIELAFRSPIDLHEPRVFNATLARFKDVRHRILGHSMGRSFQRRLISATGGFAAECPINWGWKAAGGISMLGLAWGIRAFTDAVASGPGSSSAVLKQARRVLGAEGLHDVRPWHTWLDTVLRDFVNDTLRSRLVDQTNLLDHTRVNRILDEHYEQIRPHYRTILTTLDVVLAHQHFAVT